MKRRIRIFALLMVAALGMFCLCVRAFGATYTVPSNTQSAIVSTIATAYAAGPNNTVLLPAGTYNITNSITVPCNNGLTITGPVAAPASAVLNATFTNNTIFNMSGCSGVTIEYLHFANTGGIYVSYGSNSGMTFLHNQFTGLPSLLSNLESESGIFFDGTLSSTQNNTVIEYNTFGDINSCTAVFAITGVDEGGYCSGFLDNAGTIENLTVKYNTFYHTEEGLHLVQLANFSAGHQASVADNVDIEFNYFLNFHRIATEIQTEVQGAPIIYSNNVVQDPLNVFFGTLTVSTPCCQFTNTFSTVTPVVPALYDNDNVLIASVSGQPPFGIEFWGTGSQGNNNLIEGNFSNGIVWGYGLAPWELNNNYICATVVADGGYIVNEEGQGNPPAQSGNVTGPTCHSTVSTAPTISPASGSYTSPPTITLADAGMNTSIYYTVDGSTPVPGSGTTQLYSAPFLITLPATVKAVGMWGVPPQPLSYPSGYGYVPSAWQSASYTATGGVTLTSVSLTNTGALHTLAAGATLQMTANCIYSNGATTNCNTADAYGNSVSTWASSNSAVAGISGGGLVTGLAAGTANVTAVIAGLTTPAWGMAVTSPTEALSSVALSTTGGISTLVGGAVNQLNATCTYSDNSTTNCATTDAHGDVVNPWTSSAPAIATVSSSGVVTGQAAGSTNLTATVTPSMVSSEWGQTGYDSAGNTYPGYINSTYVVLGNEAGGYSGSGATCSFYLPAGALTVGSLYDCGLIVAPTPTTQASSWLCWWTYTVTSSSAPGGFVSGTMSNCGNIAAGTALWVGVSTNQPGASPAGFDDCGGSCAGSAPTVGSGTYPYYCIAQPYGNRSGMGTAMAACGSAHNLQASQFVTLEQPSLVSNTVALTVTAAAPTLTSASLIAAGNANTMIVGGTLQFAAHCVYSDGSTTDCTVADVHGNAVTIWNTSDATKVTIGAVGSASPGLASAVAAGGASIQANVGSVVTPAINLTVSAPAVNLTGISLATTGGVTGMFVGQTNQLMATCLYSDGSTTNCTTSDSHGNVASAYSSATPAHATVNASSGLVTAVALGTTMLTATAGSFSSTAIPLTVLAVPSGVYVITISGPVKFSGSVRF